MPSQTNKRPQTAPFDCIESHMRNLHRSSYNKRGRDLKRPHTAPEACLGLRSGQALQALPSTDMFPTPQVSLRTLKRSKTLDAVQRRLESEIAPYLQKVSSMCTMTYAVGLAEYKGDPSIILVSSRPDVLANLQDKVYGGLKVVVFEGSVSMHAGMHPDTPERTRLQQMGASLGLPGSHMAGTLGQYVRQRTTKDICILTCYHVVQAAPIEPSQEAREASNFVSSVIVCPAEGDLPPMLASLDESLAHDRERLSWYETDPTKSASAEKLRAQIQADVAERESLLNQRTIGTVCAANFHLPTPENPFYSDCALVRVADGSRCTVALNAISFHPGKYCLGFTDPVKLQGRERLSLTGRTSGSTTGMLNGYQFVTSLWTPFGEANSFMALVAWNEEFQSNLSNKGDSGAAVLFGRKIVGLLYGGISVKLTTSYGADMWVDLSLFQSIVDAAAVLDFESVDDFENSLT